MAETAAHLVEHVLPEQPIRQWVLSFPYVPQRFSSFGWMTVDSCLAMIGAHYDSWDQVFINDLKWEWRLANRKIDKLSPGDQQIVAILLAVGHKPGSLCRTRLLTPIRPRYLCPRTGKWPLKSTNGVA